jgi:uncharacterized protein with HEPN domain
MFRILKEYQNIKISDLGKIVDVRNRIIHGYDSVSDEKVWGIIIKNLPTLYNEVDKLIQH